MRSSGAQRCRGGENRGVALFEVVCPRGVRTEIRQERLETTTVEAPPNNFKVHSDLQLVLLRTSPALSLLFC
jgi:hypothetical protein